MKGKAQNSNMAAQFQNLTLIEETSKKWYPNTHLH